MPKLYEYFGLIVLFYSNEHDPIHVHGVHGHRATRAELVVEGGQVVTIVYGPVKGREPLAPAQMRAFRKLVEHYHDDIVRKWIEYFVLHRRVEPEVISRRLP